MQIFIRSPANLLAFTVDKADTIQDVYNYLAEKSSYPLADLLLSFHGSPLTGDQTMAELNLCSGSTFDASIKVLGGKVHGKISNAGKVKRETPKVAPQEKPKKKTGRARRRQQYAQRFSNNVASPDSLHRGPNANH